MLNKNDYVPLYEQLRKLLRKQILKGEYKNGDLLPSENELMKMYGITRTTIRKAMEALVREGLVQQIHGRGTFVRFQEITKTVWNFQGFSSLVKERNEIPISKVFQHEVIRKNGEAYLKLRRLRGMSRDDQITWMTLDDSELPLRRFPGLDQYRFEQRSLYATLEKDYQCPPRFVNLDIIPVLSDEELMDYFGLPSIKPLLKAKGQVYDEDGHQIETVSVVYSPVFAFKLARSL